MSWQRGRKTVIIVGQLKKNGWSSIDKYDAHSSQFVLIRLIKLLLWNLIHWKYKKYFNVNNVMFCYIY